MVTTGLARPAAVVLIVLAVRLVAGVWPAAVAGALVALVVLVHVLAALDHTGTSTPARALPVERGPRGPGQLARLDGQHVAFARGLAGLADWYLTECEHEETNR